jgi:hypothetical protein
VATKKNTETKQPTVSKPDPKTEPGKVAPGDEQVLPDREQRELDALPSRLAPDGD